MTKTLVFIWMCLLPAILACRWANDWDGPLHFECPSDQFVSSVESYHSNHREDRKYKMCCRQIPRRVRLKTPRCLWTYYANDYDRMLSHDCGANGYINGFRSVHNNHYEDRRWKIRCCTAHGLRSNHCRYTGWTNDWDRPQKFITPNGYINRGVHSVHNNHYEDRRWEYLICRPRRSLLDVLQFSNQSSVNVE